MPETCIYAGFRHLFYRMALFVGGVMEYHVLGVSIIELFAGENVVNTNKSSNMNKIKFYVCLICGNVISSIGETVVSCCGIVLPALEAEAEDNDRDFILGLT